ncbi:U2 snRNP complex subunit RDS3 [Saccharomyces paradoxus]|uniref:U2 snRNP complex subunit RDS3 n=1 Tax=Saccharomyces paradoxus TaxID=27291 RepID=A0A8B8V1J8_SACPA|nr:Rds3 [Saccharomyces paradoxus]QHS76809.1 Rds3 [Saccharomyces paradoxus]
MSRHQFDLIMCLKQPGVQTGLLCEKCDGKCPICDSYVRPKRKVRICESCSFGKQAKNCIICNLNAGVNDAFYCWECCRLGKDKDGCPRILNLGSNRLDRHFEKKKKV